MIKIGTKTRWMPWTLVAMFAMGAAGCAGGVVGGSDDEDDTADATSAVQAAGPEGRGMHMGRGPMRAGPEAIFQMALHDLDLTQDQKSKIETAMKTLEGDRPKMERPDTKPLADAIRSNSVDASKLAPQGPSDADVEARRAKLASALDTLHATLDSAQRTQLATLAKEKLAKGPEMRGGHRGPDGDDADADAPKGERGRHGMREGKDGERGHAGMPGMKGRGGSPADFLLHGLDVTDEQRAKIDAALDKAGLVGPPADAPNREDMEKHMADFKAKATAMIDAFAKDDFDAKANLPEMPTGRMHGPGPARFVESLAIIVPLLDDAQRSTLADRIEQGPPDHMGPGRGYGEKRGHAAE